MIKKVTVFLLLSFVLVLLSVFYQRPSNEMIQWGNLCGLDNWMNCYHPSISGGFPFAFLFDKATTSVHNSLGFEDDFRWYPFVINMWFYFILLIFSYKSLKK